jgi:hypothetical protein
LLHDISQCAGGGQLRKKQHQEDKIDSQDQDQGQDEMRTEKALYETELYLTKIA